MKLTDIPTDLTATQIRNLLSGKSATLKPNVFNRDSENVLRLLQSTIEKIAESHKQGRGVRLALQHGEDLFKKKGGSIKIKKPKNPFKKSNDFFNDAGKEIKKEAKSKSKVVKRKFDERIVDSGLGKKIASELIDIGTQIVLPAAGSVASMAMGDPTGMSGAMVGQLAGDQLDKYAEREGYGLFKAMHKAGFHKAGINKKTVRKTAKLIGKQAIDIAAEVGGEALSMYVSPEVGESFKVNSKRMGNAALESKNGKDLLRKMKKEAVNIGVEMVDDYVDANFDGPERDVIQKAMAGKYPSAKELIYDYGNSKIEDAIQIEPNSFMAGYGFGKAKGLAKSSYELVGGSMGRPYYGGRITASGMPSNIIQVGSSAAFNDSAQMHPQFFIPSPQLAKPITKRGGSMYSAGFRRGGSFIPAG